MGRVIRREEAESGRVGVTPLLGGGSTLAAGAGGSTAARPEVVAEPVDSDREQRVRELVQAMLSGFAQQRRELLEDLQPYVVRIAVEIARRIVGRELRTDPGLITNIARGALEQIGTAANVRVRVHPLDAQILHEAILQWAPTSGEAAALEIVPDGSIERGGCLVESDQGVVDARLSTQFEEMQISLLDALESPESGGTQ